MSEDKSTHLDAVDVLKLALKPGCDLIIQRAAELMVKQLGAPVPMMLDRMLTYAAAQASLIEGSAETAAIFRRMADNIEAGCLHPVTGEGRRH